MSLADELSSAVNDIISTPWSLRDGQVVPDTDDVLLKGGGVVLKATMLYADLADSTKLASTYDRRVVAKLYKAFLTCSSRLIRATGGEIRSYDGDRVKWVCTWAATRTPQRLSAP